MTMTPDTLMFQKKCYEKYKLKWMLSHDYTLDDFLRCVMEYAQDDEDPIVSPHGILTEWEKNAGFNGSCYAGFEEFLDCEFRQPSYMQGLLAQSSTEYQQYKTILAEMNRK